MEYSEAYYVLTKYKRIPTGWIHVHTLPFLSLTVIRTYWNDILNECRHYYFSNNDIFAWAISAKLNCNDVYFYLYRRYKNGRANRVVLGNGEYIDQDYCSREFLDLFGTKDEVILVNGNYYDIM